MKLTNIYIGVLAAASILAAGCSKKFLEEKRDLTGTNEEVFKDSLLAKTYVDYIYGLFLPANNGTPFIQGQEATATGAYSSTFTQTTDELAGETDFNKEWATISYTNNHANQYFGQKMTSGIVNNSWTRMKQINVFLTSVDNYGIPKPTRDLFKGQLYFWRAWQYFELLKMYGGVPIVLVSYNPITDIEVAKIPRSTSAATVDQIVADLDTAISLLPGKWAAADVGRITSGAAAALKGRVLLTWASPLFNRTDDRARWKRAYDANLAAKTLLVANGYGLYKKGTLSDGTAWANMFTDEANNPEAVFIYGFNTINVGNPQRNDGWEQATRSKEILGSGGVAPTKDIMDAFPMKDGKAIGESGAYTYDVNKFYKNRDPRFYKTFIYNGALWPYGGNNTYRQWTYTWKKAASDATYTISTETKGATASGIYLCKADNLTASNANGNFTFSGTDFAEIRFAEVVLNLAECAIGNDQLAEGLEGIKSIRERAGLEKGTDGNYGIGSAVGNRDKLFGAIINERKVEFAYEGKRFWDLRRWLLFDDTYGTVTRLGQKPINGMRRTGIYVSVKKTDGTDYVDSKVDPLIKQSNGTVPVIDRDVVTTGPYPPGVSNPDQYIDYLYTNYFKVSVKDDLEKVVTPAWKFRWYKEYYFFGLHSNILSGSPYLEQTTGWNSLTGMGTFDPLK